MAADPARRTNGVPAPIVTATLRDRAAITSLLAQLTPADVGAKLRISESGQMRELVDLYDRMIETDAEIRSDFETRVSAVAGARYVIEPGETGIPERDALAGDAAAFVARCLENMTGYDEATSSALCAIGYGYEALQKHWIAEDDALVIKRLEWIHPRRFRYGNGMGPGFDLRIVDTGTEYRSNGIELDRDLWLVHEPATLAGYPTRSGVLRACVWPYLFKRWCHQFWNAGAERFAWPFIYAKVPRGAPDDVRNAARAGLEELSADHAAVIEDPSAFQLLETTVKDGGTWKDLNAGMNAEIAKAIFGMTDLSEPSKIGAYAAVESRRGATVATRIAMDERSLAATMRDQLAEPLLRFNLPRFGGVLPAVPWIRRKVSSERKAIPSELLPVATVDEARESVGLPPFGGARGEALFTPQAKPAPSAPTIPPTARRR